MVDLNRIISSALKSGKMLLGLKQAVTAAKTGRAVALIVASNCPTKTLADIQQSSGQSKIPLFVYPASNSDLGIACGKPFHVTAITIREISEPEILRMIQEATKATENKG